MFDDLDRTLSYLLRNDLPPNLVGQVTVSFATPDAQFPPPSVSPPAVNLFLYEIQENRELRGHEPQIERLADAYVHRTPAPVRIDCHYLVTAWAKTGAPSPEEDEHQILGEVLRVLLRHREIPPEALRGKLKDQVYPVRARVSPPSVQQSRGDFWQALGGKPKAAFHYTVTLAVDVHKAENAEPVVETSGSGKT